MKLKLTILVFLLSINFSYATGESIDQNKIHKNLRCLICQGQSVADSNSEFAQTIKLVVKDLVRDGKTEDEIYSFLSDKYGEWIVYKPRFNQQNIILWMLPYLIFVAGGLIIFFVTKKKTKND